MNQVGSLLSAFFTEKEVVDFESATSSNTQAYTNYFNHMLQNGIYVAPSQYEAMFVSMAHTREEIEQTCQCIIGQ